MSRPARPANRPSYTETEALAFHAEGKPGKLEVRATKPMATQRDLALAYSPGVAVPVKAIAENPDKAFDYTARGNFVAVITNGTAILGLGNLGALASKPVMEGKSVLFKRFADVDAFDIELDTEDPDEFINAVRYMGPTFSGINLEDIKAPECFIIEERLRELMDIPVFHDDQHGTAIITIAGLINAIELTGRDLKDIKVVCNGAGAAAIACLNLAVTLGVPRKNMILCDSKGPVYKGRKEGINQWKSAFASDTKARSLAEAMKGADVVFGLSVGGAISADMVASMAPKPIIFAMANPDPEITPEEVLQVRSDAIMATGRSDYPNQVNNILGFPYIFRGAIDVHARTINDEMKLAAAHALARLAREDVPDEVAAAYHGQRLKFGPGYIIPSPFDPRLISTVSTAVAKAAMETGVARRPIEDLDAYSAKLAARLDPITGLLQRVYDQVREKPKLMVFAEGEEEKMIRAAHSFASNGLGRAILVGRDEEINKTLVSSGLQLHEGVQILNARLSSRKADYAAHLYERLKRKGYLLRDCQRLVNTDRNVFAACMVALGDADGLITGITRKYSVALDNIRLAVDDRPGHRPIGVSLAMCGNRQVFIADTSILEMPNPVELADIAEEAAGVARRLGHTPRVAFLSYSTFGHPQGERVKNSRDAVAELDRRDVDFEYDGEMAADIALSREKMADYPFCRLSGPANVLVMPAAHSASISTKMLQELGGITVIGPLLVGLEHPVQIASKSANTTDLLNMAVIA
ncbi:MAG TPA: NADP-dependent malic enzyme, partial [Rhizobiales bacterium]|nr:NADP-dependent malic enzyme [Hyphomicrobiales bacterium]